MKLLMSKKKLVGGHKTYKIITFCIVLLFSNVLNSSQIYDFQTEQLIEKLTSQILSVNTYNKKIHIKIINEDFPNAFVTEDNTIYLSSGLFIYSPDYVSVLAVLAHEIGHIEKYHISKRKNEINNLKKINNLGNIASIAGSMLIQQPELINTIIVNQTALKNLYINFSQEQEKEADLYAVDTLNNLNLSTNSIKKFLLLLEKKTNSDLIDNELKKFSTHPLFQERYDIIDYKKGSDGDNFNQDYQNDFQFIKAKFMAYTNNNLIYYLNKDEKIYYDAIRHSISGDLNLSLKKLNSLISKYNKNTFLFETKADILFSYGYNKEATEFYKKILIKYPQNNYAKFNIFMYSDFINEDKISIKKIFLDHQYLIEYFPNNKNFITKYYNLSKILEYKDWITFFEILLFKKEDPEITLKQLFKLTEDTNLKKIIKIYT